MGRRKIEIQPITHERNRSVTFLKRKNGLFKKAYELGVLCSVDVAVIIFEERAGHHPKVYQYGSRNVNNIVERHIRFDGERDNKGPNDFSAGAGDKIDDVDDEDVDEDEIDVPVCRGSKREGDGSLRSSIAGEASHHALSSKIDYASNRMQPPVSVLPSSTSTSLSTSSDRHSMGHGNQHTYNKRQRLSISAHSPTSSDDTLHNASGTNYLYHSSHPSPSNNPRQQIPGHPQYGTFFPIPSHSPPPSFIPLQANFSPLSSRGQPPPHPLAGRGGYTHRGSSYGQGMYQQMTRPQPQSQNDTSDIFAAFLNADEHLRQATLNVNAHEHEGSGGFDAALDWPVHGGTPRPGRYVPPPPPASGHTGSGSHAPTPSASQADPSWLDYLSSGGSNVHAETQNSNVGHGAGRGRGNETLSWERGGDKREAADGISGMGIKKEKKGRSPSSEGPNIRVKRNSHEIVLPRPGDEGEMERVAKEDMIAD